MEPKAENYLKLARSIAKKYTKPKENPMDSDAYSDALLGLVYALRRFKPELGYKFTTLAHRCMRNTIFDEHKKRKRKIVTVPLDEDICDPANFLNRVMVEDLLDKDDTDRTILRKYYLEGCSHSEIGRMIGLPESTVGDRKRRTIRRMKNGRQGAFS